MLNTFIRVYVHNHKYIYPRQCIFVPFKEKKTLLGSKGAPYVIVCAQILR